MRKIHSLPEFKGLERHYLKAQLVRISFANQIVPTGCYNEKADDDTQIEYNKEFEFPAYAQISDFSYFTTVND